MLRHRQSGFSLAHLCHAGVQLRQELVGIVLEYAEGFLKTQCFVLAAHLLEASGCGSCLGSRKIGEHAPQGVGRGSDAVSIFRIHRFAQGKKLARKIFFEDRKKVAEQFTIVLDAREQFLMIKNQRSQFFPRFLRGLLILGPACFVSLFISAQSAMHSRAIQRRSETSTINVLSLDAQAMEKFAPGMAVAGTREIESFQDSASHRPTASLPRMISYVVGEGRTQEFPEGKGAPG